MEIKPLNCFFQHCHHLQNRFNGYREIAVEHASIVDTECGCDRQSIFGQKMAKWLSANSFVGLNYLCSKRGILGLHSRQYQDFWIGKMGRDHGFTILGLQSVTVIMRQMSNFQTLTFVAKAVCHLLYAKNELLTTAIFKRKDRGSKLLQGHHHNGRSTTR